MAPAEPPLRKAAVAVALLCCWQAREAGAQLTGSVGVVSDYLYRGSSLSQGKPAAQLTLAYDSPDGWHAGVFAARVKLAGAARGSMQYIGYAGYARRLASGLSWDAGAAHYAYKPDSTQDYQELHAGLAADRVNARIAYSPDYLGLGIPTAYAEMNGSYPLWRDVSLFAHAGYLASLSASPLFGDMRQMDGRVGLGAELGGFRWQLAWDASRGRTSGYGWQKAASGSRGDVVVSVSRPF
ncbi:conserved hypothetical protein [Pseudoduganella namucuonensis]|uniref:Cellulose biosynthesis protein BcsS n=1 Tax=Pseudoduganella namucuonensis TaxID=1035707 RepID=A0A1I7KTI2_9BURK|nr:conserved hypothetical protein [Pseudoduganella namucuonensis]